MNHIDMHTRTHSVGLVRVLRLVRPYSHRRDSTVAAVWTAASATITAARSAPLAAPLLFLRRPLLVLLIECHDDIKDDDQVRHPDRTKPGVHVDVDDSSARREVSNGEQSQYNAGLKKNFGQS